MKAKWFVLALAAVPLAVTQAGCLLVAGAGLGAAGYAYHEGKARHFYPYPVDVVYGATLQALGDLQLQVVEHACDRFSGRIAAYDAGRRKIVIELEPKGIGTKIGVRVGTFGDEPISQGILRQTELHLPPTAQPGLPSPAGPPPAHLEPVPAAVQPAPK